MADLKSSGNSLRFSAMRLMPHFQILPTLLCFVLGACLMAGGVGYFYKNGSTLYFGDAEAHLNIARRVLDSRTPGWYQLGTTWLPLPHLLMIPLARYDRLWQTGLAGAIPAGICMTIAATFLFAAVRREFASITAATAATAVFLLNPNTLYLGSIPMTEPVFFACLFALLYFTVRFAATRGWGALLGASLAACAGTLTRYEGWILVPFAALFILLRGRWKPCLVFCLIAGAGPILWLAHNRWYFGDPFYFYRGPYSALTIQGKLAYPGRSDWRAAAHYYFEAGRLVAGWPAMLLGAAGLVLAVMRRNRWPVLLLALPPAFYVWSIHSSATPVFVPTLWPNSWYNTRYAMALLPPIVIGVAAIARMSNPIAAAVAVLALAPFMIRPAERSITWQESDVNSRARRQWTARAAHYLTLAADPHDTFFTSFNDLTGIYRAAGIPLRATLTGNNDVEWAEATTRPDLFLHEDWAVVTGGDVAQGVIDRARLHGPRYELETRIVVRGAPAIEIYHKVDENPVF